MPEPGTAVPGSSDHRPPAAGEAAPDEPPPFGVSWRTLYGVVACTLVALIVLFVLFTRAFQ